MKRVTVKEFFTVLWSGLCQVLAWFFGLFGYKRDGKFAKYVWRVFATSMAVIASLMALGLTYCAGRALYLRYELGHHNCLDPDCYESTFISPGIYYHEDPDGNGYIYDRKSGNKTLRHVSWVAMPVGNDSLVCFSNGKKRGYFSKYTGKEVISPRYDRAWIFSDGLACVEEEGRIRFIDQNGKVAIDNNLMPNPGTLGYVFHGGYCMVHTSHGELWGLMDKTGKMVLPREYDYITPSDDYEYWCIRKGDEMAVIDRNLSFVLPMTPSEVCVQDGAINVTMPDHTMRKYDLHGGLINDFYYTSVRVLEYEKDEILYHLESVPAECEEESVSTTEIESYHPKATARLRAYVAGDCFEGLMTDDGHKVTMPLYKDIEAIGHDLYLCTSTNSDKVIVNGRGEIVK